MPKLSDAEKIWAIMLSVIVTMILIMIAHQNIMNKRQHDSFALCLKSGVPSEYSTYDSIGCASILRK
jgi:hypothetical protein